MNDIQWSDSEKEVFNSCFIEGNWDDEAYYLRYVFKNGQSWQVVKTPKATIQDIESYIEDMVLSAESIGYKGRPSETAKAISAGSPSSIEFVPTIKPECVSRRDYFAAMAMQGLLTARIVSGSNMRLAVEAADALIAELDKEDKSK